jgi:hypothetical protein
MKATFGILSLLVALAIVAVLARTQLKAVSRAPASSDVGTSMPAPTGNVREQSQQTQEKVRNDVTRALEQGAARKEEADK